ncbi:MAG: hypothetical protein IT164_13945 [Bryobacterales bacterium]|nr:hypothetical protein [Bryobacterales bacterium]
MIRFTPSRNYLAAGVVALAFAILCGWYAWRWAPSYIPSFLFLFTAGLLFTMAFRPAIEVSEKLLKVGGREILWEEVYKVDTTGWVQPLVLSITLESEEKIWLVVTSELEQNHKLLGLLHRYAYSAALDGVPFQDFWGERGPGAGGKKTQAEAKQDAPKYPLLSPEDEAEVERLYHRLKSVGHMDQRGGEEN